MAFKVGVVGIDHGHIIGMLQYMLEQGCVCSAYWTDGSAVTEQKFNRMFPKVARANDRRTILEDPEVRMVLIAAVPADRAKLAIEAMLAGKDVMVDKPGCTTLDQLAELERVQAKSGRIWSVNFSERFQVPAATRASELVADGAIGRVVHTIGIGPHKQNLKTRPMWFVERERYGGILCDIGSHQVDQFLHYTGSHTATVEYAHVANYSAPTTPGFQDFGEVSLRSEFGSAYIRVDWFTPDGLPTWGDGRLFIQGTEGFIELRKYTDAGRTHRTNNLILVNGTKNELIPCDGAGLPYFPRLVADVQDRTQTAVSQDHTFTTMRIAIEAQMKAEGR